MTSIQYLCPMQIKSAKYVISSPDFEKCPLPDRPEYAFIGRSNVGKSSLINMLCDNDKLAKTSGSPGKTQLLNHFEISSAPTPKANQTGPSSGTIKRTAWYLVDLPGYGYAKVGLGKRKQWIKMIENYIMQLGETTGTEYQITWKYE